jgi:hypothetical protein
MSLYYSNKRVLLKKQYKKIYYKHNGRPYITYGGTPHDLENRFESIKDEEEFACFVHSDDNVLRFAFKIMYNTIKKAQEIGLTKEVIIEAISEHTLEDNMIKKPGFTIDEANFIYKEVLSKDEDTVFTNINTKYTKYSKLHQIMGSFYPFTINPDFILGVIEGNENLKIYTMERIKIIFCLPNNYTDWDNIKSLLINDNKWLYLDIFAFGSNCPESLYRRGMLNLPYIRKKVSDIKGIKSVEPTQCHINAINTKGSKIIKSNSWYVVEEDMFFAKILKSFNRNYIAGPSGSAILAYIFVFTLLDFDTSQLNKMMLLSCIIGDYIPYYHSLTEILMTYTFEIDAQYDLSIDPVFFAKKLIKPYLANLKYGDMTILGGKNKQIINKSKNK